MKPIRDAILSLESSKATLADCYFSFADLINQLIRFLMKMKMQDFISIQ